MSLIINPYSFGGFSGILDTYSSAAGAYSFRKLRSAYSGSSFRVRRSSDNAESDIGFDSTGNLDESALTTFVGANSGYVAKWYDQSGNGRDLTQTTSGNQYLIVDSGTVTKLNSKPVLTPVGTSSYLIPPDALAVAFAGTDIPLSFFAVLYQPTDQYANIFRFDTEIGGNYYGLRSMTLSQYRYFEALKFDDASNYSSGISDYEGHSFNTQYVCQFIDTGTAGAFYLNSSAKGTISVDVGQILLSRTFSMLSGGVKWQEVIMFASDKTSDRTGIRDNINTYFGVY